MGNEHTQDALQGILCKRTNFRNTFYVCKIKLKKYNQNLHENYILCHKIIGNTQNNYKGCFQTSYKSWYRGLYRWFWEKNVKCTLSNNSYNNLNKPESK